MRSVFTEDVDRTFNLKRKISMYSDDRKRKQLEIILSINPCRDEYHTWIRSIDDILTLEEAVLDPDYDYDEYDPDWSRADALEAISKGKITVFSSYPITQGMFVTPSRMEAEAYSKNGKVYSKLLNIEDIAWLDPTQGQVAIIS